MILRAKEISDCEVLFQNMPTDTLIRFGNFDSLGPNGAGPFNGIPLDPFRDINRDTFAVRYDKTFMVNAPVAFQGSMDVDFSVIPSTTKRFRHKLDFGKRGLKLKYSTSADQEPNNFPYFLCVGYSSTTGTSSPENNKCRLTMSCVGTYTDA